MFKRPIPNIWRKAFKIILLLLLTAVLGLLAYAYWPVSPDFSHLAVAPGAYDVEIRRDTWGVPHIYGQTDADVAFGLAYAHAEDDFRTIQDTLAAAKGKLGEIYGPDSAPIDYVLALLRVRETLTARYLSDITPEARAIAAAYADGLNHYAAHHPEAALAPLFPVTGQDVIAGFMLRTPLFFGLDSTIQSLYGEERPSAIASDAAPPMVSGLVGLLANQPPNYPTHQPSNQPAPPLQNPWANRGSNAFAINADRSADGSTWLAINSHQPWDGPVAWYEAHLHSEAGWHAYGGAFPGAPLILHGFNQQLGWAFTVNNPDLIDVYVLELNPDDPNQYRFDGQWRDLEVRQVPLRVKLFGRFTWTVRQEALWSVYGPTIRQPHGTYAIRYASMGEVGYIDQWLGLNKATSLAEWQAALAAGPLPMFNAGYADQAGNIYYVYNGRLPQRPPGYPWDSFLPGNTAATLWTDYLPYDQLPQVLNPPAGFVQNANSSPFQTTLGEGNPDPAAYPAASGIETSISNRALRLRQLLSEKETINEAEFIAIKYDVGYTAASDMGRLIELLLTAPSPPDNPDWLPAIVLLRDWDRQATLESRGATLGLLTLYFLDEMEGTEINGSNLNGGAFTLAQAMAAFEQTLSHLQIHFGRVDVAWGNVNRLRRGGVDLAIGGGPDLLHAVYGEFDADGRLRGNAGDGLVIIVGWDADGRLTAHSIHQYGSATRNEASPHYADQSPLFVQRQLKPIWFTEEDVLANLERAYQPGAE